MKVGRSMAKITNLPRDLMEDILSRVPLTSMRAVRTTCKKWNALSKDGTFTKKHLAHAAAASSEGEFLAIVTMNCCLYLMSVNLQGGIHNDGFHPSIRPTGKLTSLDDSDRVVVSRICYCEGLLLCTTEAYTSLVVWNPYSGQTRWISVEPTSVHHRKLWYAHALGYDKDRSTHKILRFAHLDSERSVHEIYRLNSKSWSVLDVTPYWDQVEYDNHGLSLKGNTYWYATDQDSQQRGFLLYFDFTTERFAPRLLLPFSSYYGDAVTLSSVREEQLAVLFQHRDSFEMEIWVANKIEPNAVTWSRFLAVDMAPLTGFRFDTGRSFIVDEENSAVVVFDEDRNVEKPTRNKAYFVGENGYFREVDLGKITTGREGFPHACSYVPSPVKINQPA